jgi:hypothetical protein
VSDIRCIFLAGLHRAERNIGGQLLMMANRVVPWPPIDPDKALPWVEQRGGLRQSHACYSVGKSPALTGSRLTP